MEVLLQVRSKQEGLHKTACGLYVRSFIKAQNAYTGMMSVLASKRNRW